jgi:ketosteroid isomerase-like protein
MKKVKYAEFDAAKPYFDLVRGALGTLVEGEHFFDVVADNVVYEVLYDLGWPRIIEGRPDLMKQFAGYGDYIKIKSADHLIVHKADAGNIVVIEYEVHGKVLSTGKPYDNRFASIIKLENRKIVHWRDYMDSFAAWTALNGK